MSFSSFPPAAVGKIGWYMSSVAVPREQQTNRGNKFGPQGSLTSSYYQERVATIECWNENQLVNEKLILPTSRTECLMFVFTPPYQNLTKHIKTWLKDSFLIFLLSFNDWYLTDRRNVSSPLQGKVSVRDLDPQMCLYPLNNTAFKQLL